MELCGENEATQAEQRRVLAGACGAKRAALRGRSPAPSGTWALGGKGTWLGQTLCRRGRKTLGEGRAGSGALSASPASSGRRPAR